MRLEPGAHPLPFGTLQVTLDESGLSWGGYRLDQFVSTTTLEVRGLRNRYRRPGLGAPPGGEPGAGQGVGERPRGGAHRAPDEGGGDGLAAS